MKIITTLLCILIGFTAGKIHSPAEAYEAPQELVMAVREALLAAYELGKQERGDDIGLVRLTETQIEELIK